MAAAWHHRAGMAHGGGETSPTHGIATLAESVNVMCKRW